MNIEDVTFDSVPTKIYCFNLAGTNMYMPVPVTYQHSSPSPTIFVKDKNIAEDGFCFGDLARMLGEYDFSKQCYRDHRGALVNQMKNLGYYPIMRIQNIGTTAEESYRILLDRLRLIEQDYAKNPPSREKREERRRIYHDIESIFAARDVHVGPSVASAICDVTELMLSKDRNRGKGQRSL